MKASTHRRNGSMTPLSDDNPFGPDALAHVRGIEQAIEEERAALRRQHEQEGLSPPRSEIYRLTLPVPPSSNRYWRRGRNGQIYVSEEAEAYRTQVARAVRKIVAEPLGGEIAFVVRWYRGERRGDLNNRIKILEDALRKALYVDDKQIVESFHRRFEDKEFPRMEIETWEI